MNGIIAAVRDGAVALARWAGLKKRARRPRRPGLPDRLSEFLAAVKSACPELDVEQVQSDALALARYYGGAGNRPPMLGSLEVRWYDSLARGEPDFSVYTEPQFVAESWACWSVYSRRYVAQVADAFARGLIRAPASVLDLGCGVGLSTAALAALWPTASVYGTNFTATPQGKVAAKFAFVACAPAGPSDLVFASEYFEHHMKPVDHLRAVLAECKPKTLVLANSFGSRSVGHFESYLDGAGDVKTGKTIGRAFNAELRARGYRPVKTGFWNNRPAIWELAS